MECMSSSYAPHDLVLCNGNRSEGAKDSQLELQPLLHFASQTQLHEVMV